MTQAAMRIEEAAPVVAAARAALYLRVSTPRQAEHDLSIPDQRRQMENYCLAKAGTPFRNSSNRATRRPMTAVRRSRR